MPTDNHIHAFLYQTAARIVHVRLSTGQTASFPPDLAWLKAISWAADRAKTIEVRT